MREAFAHEAVLAMGPDADIRAPGAAITVELCGQFEHEPPCPLAAHHTHAERDGEDVRIRTLFATESDQETTVRDRIHATLSAGQLDAPSGITRWQLRSGGPCAVTSEERAHAERLRYS
jgi:hypothetical protein